MSADYQNVLDVDLELGLQVPALLPSAALSLGWKVGRAGAKEFRVKAIAGSAHYEADVSAEWSPKESDISLKVVLDGRQSLLTSRRSGWLETLRTELRLADGRSLLLKVSSDLRGRKDFELDANLEAKNYGNGPPKQLVAITVKSDGKADGGFKAEGKIVADAGPLSIDYKVEVKGGSKVQDSLVIEVFSSSESVLSVEVREEFEGRYITIKESVTERFLEISSNLYQFKTLPKDTSLDLYVHYKRGNSETRTAHFEINRAKKTASIAVDDALTAEVQLAGSSKAVATLGGSLLGNKEHKATIEYIGEEGWEGEQGLRLDISLEGDPILKGEATLEIEQRGQVEAGVEFEGKIELPKKARKMSVKIELSRKGDDEKNGEVRLEWGQDKKLEIELSKESSGAFRLEVESPAALLKSFELRFDPPASPAAETRTYEGSIRYNEGKPGAFSFSFSGSIGESAKEVGIVAETEGNRLTSSVRVDLEARSLVSNLKFNERSIDLSVKAQGDDGLVLDFSSPFPGMTSLHLEGTWERTDTASRRGVAMEAKGQIELEPLYFRAEASRSDGEANVSWAMTKGTKQIKFRMVTASDDSSKEVSVDLDVFEQHSEFRMRYGVEDSNFLAATASFKTPLPVLREGRVEFRVGYQGPKNLEFTASASKSPPVSSSLGGTDVLFSFRNVFNYESLENIVVRHVLEVPPLGVSRKALQVVFSVRSKRDFEVLAEVTSGVHSYGSGVRYRRGEDDVEASARFSLGERTEYEITVGGERKCGGKEGQARTQFLVDTSIPL